MPPRRAGPPTLMPPWRRRPGAPAARFEAAGPAQKRGFAHQHLRRVVTSAGQLKRKARAGRRRFPPSASRRPPPLHGCRRPAGCRLGCQMWGSAQAAALDRVLAQTSGAGPVQALHAPPPTLPPALRHCCRPAACRHCTLTRFAHQQVRCAAPEGRRAPAPRQAGPACATSWRSLQAARIGRYSAALLAAPVQRERPVSSRAEQFARPAELSQQACVPMPTLAPSTRSALPLHSDL